MHRHDSIPAILVALCAGGFLPVLTAQDPDPFPYYNYEPYLQSLTSTSVVIVSQSKEPRVARLQYGLDEEMAIRIEEDGPRHDHVFRLEGLQPDTVYHYRVFHLEDSTFARMQLRTLPQPGAPVLVAAIGDSGTLSDAQLAIADLLLALQPAILLHAGDTVYPYGTPQNYREKLFQVYKRLFRSTCFYPSLGNHDCFISPDYWLKSFYTPANNPAGSRAYYSFDAGDAHFAVLNSCEGDMPQEQLDWLDADLTQTARIWRILLFHHPPYSNAFHGGNIEIRAALAPVLEKHGVELVINGHDHVYERSYPILDNQMRDAFQEPSYVAPRGTIFVVTGGGGATLYDYKPTPAAHLSAVFKEEHHYFKLLITPEALEGTAVNEEGLEIDRFSIKKSGEVAPLRFVRGDANQDREVNLADGVVILGYLFSGAPPPCLAASDIDASGEIRLSDAVQVFNYLFLGGVPPAGPHPECGTLQEAVDVGCKGGCEDV